MEFLKKYSMFIKEGNESSDELFNEVEIDDEMLKNIRELPSEMWSPDMIDANVKYESMIEDELYNVEDSDDAIDDIEGNEIINKKMVHNPEETTEISEKYSELEEYEIKDIFKQEEEENESE